MIQYEIAVSFDAFLNLAHSFSNHNPMQLLLSGDQTELNPSYLFLFPSDQIEPFDVDAWKVLKQKLSFAPDSKNPLWCGYLSYEMGSLSDVDKKLDLFDSPIPLTCFFKPSVICKYQKQKLSVSYCETKPFHEDKKVFSEPKLLLDYIHTLNSYTPSTLEAEVVCESDTQKSYLEKIQKAKDYIISGDIYQVNLSRSTKFKTKASAFDIFYALFQVNPTPFSAYINWGPFQIISASPERFLKKRDSILETRPIKGTIQRGGNPSEDIVLRNKLLNCPKEEAELSMITDLMRNDLGKVSEIGSVHCPHLKRMLELSNVFHLESTVLSKPNQLHPLDIIRSCFPAGSISGCPKIRAQEIIYELEARARHIYCGSIGYFMENGDFDFNVAIRTALLKDSILEVQMGGAITYDSNEVSEYKETAHKGSPFFKIFENSSMPFIFETIHRN